jgi:hypothetical protein
MWAVAGPARPGDQLDWRGSGLRGEEMKKWVTW